jgi:hypothetical protein
MALASLVSRKLFISLFIKKNNTLPDGRKRLPFPRAFSRSSYQQFKRKIFYYGLKKNIYDFKLALLD